MTNSILTILKDTMNVISAGLMGPTIAILLLFVAYMVIQLGSLLAELLTERRQARFDLTGLLEGFQTQSIEEMLASIASSSLLGRQKLALGELITHSDLPAASHQALARRLLSCEELYYTRITNRTDLVARLGPMLGLMATLIPLGPGLIALGQGETALLADSLLTAFDATVTGLAAAGVAFVISLVRKRWYEDYLSTLEAAMESLLEVFAHRRGIEE